jgi:hypothetical protein
MLVENKSKNDSTKFGSSNYWLPCRYYNDPRSIPRCTFFQGFFRSKGGRDKVLKREENTLLSGYSQKCHVTKLTLAVTE